MAEYSSKEFAANNKKQPQIVEQDLGVSIKGQVTRTKNKSQISFFSKLPTFVKPKMHIKCKVYSSHHNQLAIMF